MSSRRKSSTPCMIRLEVTPVALDEEEQSHGIERTENLVQEAPINGDSSIQAEPSMDSDQTNKAANPPIGPDKPETEPPDPFKPQHRQQGGYECKYCPFSTQNLNNFKEHVDANHPNVILNPLYLCAVCNFNTKKFDTLTEHNEICHPGESNFKFKRIRMNNQTILEQTIEGCSNNAIIYNMSGVLPGKGDGLGSQLLCKLTTVKNQKQKTMSTDIKWTEPHLGKLIPDLAKKPITALNVNGTVIIPESALLTADGLSHIMPSLQQPINYTKVPKIAVPLNTNKYNPSLDDNLMLISSFNKFPYPTQAELSWLTAASKHPEEQIKVWFTTQRLKQGISWSPEEVEEARKKMFNGTISSVPQTLTVVAPQLNSHSSSSQFVHTTSANHLQPIASVLQSVPCQILGQSSLVLTPVANCSTVTCAPLAFTVANQVVQSLKRPLTTPVISTDRKRPSIIQTISALTATSKLASPKAVNFIVDPNKTAEQLSVLRSSYSHCHLPEEDEIYRLIETTGLSRGEIKKWFSEQRLLNLKSAPALPVLVKAETMLPIKDSPVRKAVPNQFPLLERVKGKTSKQLNALEESFQRSCSPVDADLDHLAQETRLSRIEVDCWFSERRALRDNMEKVLLTLAAKNSEDRLEQPGGVLLNGASHEKQERKSSLSSSYPPILSSSSTSSSPPVLAVSSPQVPAHSPSVSPPILNSSCSSSPPPHLSVFTNPTTIYSHSLALLREMFCRTQWPSPEEYSQLEVQTNLGRTDIVRWFKDHRSALKNNETLDWMEGFQNLVDQQKAGQQQNTCSSENNQSVLLGVKALCAAEEGGGNEAASENFKLPNKDRGHWLTDRLTQGITSLSRIRQHQNNSVDADKVRWVKVTVNVGDETEGGEERQLLAADTDLSTLEQTGRVIG